MAPQTSQRSSRPGGAVAGLDRATRRRCYAWLGPALSSKRTGVLPRR